VYEILKHACNQINTSPEVINVYLEMESAVTIFDERNIPDFMVMRKS